MIISDVEPFILSCSDCFSGFPCPLCRSQRNGVLPFAPRSLDTLIENVLSSCPSQLREHRSALNDVAAQAVAAFSVCRV
jgi:hypothetical protein